MKKTTTFLVLTLLSMSLIMPSYASNTTAQDSSATLKNGLQNGLQDGFKDGLKDGLKNGLQDGQKHPPKGDNIGEPPGGYGKIAPPDGDYKEGFKNGMQNGLKEGLKNGYKEGFKKESSDSN